MLQVIMAYVLAAYARVRDANYRAGSELIKTIEEVDEFGINAKTRVVARRFSRASRGQLGLQTVLAALVVVIAVSLAVIVVDRFDQSLGTPDSTALSESQQDTLTGFADMTSLVGPLLLVAMAVVIIGLIRRVS